MSDIRHVVVVGGGFAGVAAAKRVAKDARVQVTLLDQNNYHQFQPLLYQVATCQLAQTDIAYPARDKGLKRVLVTGFDPFTLDRDIRISNPSGATALALDGTVIETTHGPARIETAVFPVRWQDFTEGSVERALQDQQEGHVEPAHEQPQG